MKKIIVVLILGILFASCGSSRGCKKMRKYRKYWKLEMVEALVNDKSNLNE